jgi:hypothetical protein
MTDSRHGLGEKICPQSHEIVILYYPDENIWEYKKRGLGVVIGYTLTSNDRCYVAIQRLR